MFYKLILCLALLGSASSLLPGQTLDWIFLEDSEGCASAQTDCATGRQCYGLLYNPGLTGTVTSYTFGFLANCVEGGTAALSGLSCTMTDNTDIQSACAQANLLQILPSGNSGSLAVIAGVPVILHEVCLTLAPGQSMTFTEDESLSLTVSVDLTGGGAATDRLNYSAFSASSADCGTTLPVTWEGFTVRQESKVAHINWSTSDETGHDFFSVEWGTDGRTFLSLATVREAEQQAGALSNYSFIHQEPAEGINYYRIRQVDFTGEYSFSPVESLEFRRSDADQSFRLFPNPAFQAVQLSFSADLLVQKVIIYGTDGKRVRTVAVPAGAETVTCSLDGLPTGLYLVRAGDQTRRLVKW